jgi:glycerol-3-phosphate acyltransferase PlsY
VRSDAYLFVLLIAVPVATPIIAYLIGSIPWAYLIVKWASHEDITTHGTGNVGAMNVKRTTGSWGWFTVAMVADAAKGFFPALLAKLATAGVPLDWGVAARPWSDTLRPILADSAALAASDWLYVVGLCVPMLAVFGAVFGHNYSLWLAIKNRKFARTGKGLATGGGALLAYDWRYFLVVVVVGLLTIAITKYMMAGQVSAAWSLPVFAIATRQPDWPFALLMGLIVYWAHHKRFIGLLQGKEPRFYTKDAMGPRG